MAAARQRWRMLAHAITSNKTLPNNVSNRHSVRRFTTFGLFHIEPSQFSVDEGKFIENASKSNEHELDVLDTRTDTGQVETFLENGSSDSQCNGDVKCEDWFDYSVPSLMNEPVRIRHLPQNLSPETLQGFNNTGNICVWVSEEVMAYYCLRNIEQFRRKSIVELGGGMTCLAGCVIAKTVPTTEIVLSDGNNDSVDNLSQIITANTNLIKSDKITAKCLRWPLSKDSHDLLGNFDVVLCADCLFFDEGRTDLIDTMHELLKPGGTVVIFAPSRGETFNAFVGAAQGLFHVVVSDNYDSYISGLHNSMRSKGVEVYDENLHYPRLIHMVKQ